MPTSLGDDAQIRVIAEQVAKATLVQMTAHVDDKLHLNDKVDVPIPPLIKWLVGAIGGFGAAALIGLGFWVVTSISQMQVTLARMDERMVSGAVKDSRVDQIDRRVTALELVNADALRKSAAQ